MSDHPAASSTSLDSAVAQVRELDDRTISAAQSTTAESIRIYEQMLAYLAGAQEKAGDRGAECLREVGAAQAKGTRFGREVSS
jgi:hypothetical protein